MRRILANSRHLPGMTYLLLACSALIFAVLGCSDDTTSVGDTVPPARVTNLSVSAVTHSSASLRWTAPGDDGIEGTASEYDLRYSQTEITEESWTSATPASPQPEPSERGTLESHTITGLEEGTLYYFVLKSADEVPNWSDLSNVDSGTTSFPDTIPPTRVSDLQVTAVSDSTISLSWTTPDDPMRVAGLAQYDVRYSQEEIDEQTWESAQQAEGEPVPGEPSSLESFTLAGLERATTYFIALKTADGALNWSDLSNVVQGQTRDAFTIDPDGTGDFPTIQEAIDAIPSGSIIELSDGTFSGNLNRDLDFMGKALTLRSQSGDPENCVINCEGTGSDPHRGFVFQSGEGPSTVIQDISVRDGYASGTEFPTGYGGAVLCINGSNPTFKGCVFSECDALSGGAVFIRDSDPILEDCGFFFNNADVGAALRIENSSAELTSCTFTRNDAFSRGGGLSYSGQFLSLEYCDFIENTAAAAGGAICLDSDASLTLVNCEFSLNVAVGGGGGAVGMLDGASGAGLTAVDCTFADNASNFGAAAFLIGSSLDFIRCSFFGNSVSGVIGLGGAISVVENSDLSISECFFTANESTRSGGALFVNQSSCELLNSVLTGNHSGGDAGAVHVFLASLEVDMCTFASNRAAEIGGGIFLEGSDALLERSILWGNCAGVAAGEAYLTFNLEDTQLGFICSAVDSAGISGEGTVSYLGPQVFSDPFFCDPSTCDAAPTMDGDYSLSATSPCLEENSPCGDQVGALGQGCD